jgi:hypothetical protein
MQLCTAVHRCRKELPNSPNNPQAVYMHIHYSFTQGPKPWIPHLLLPQYHTQAHTPSLTLDTQPINQSFKPGFKPPETVPKDGP